MHDYIGKISIFVEATFPEGKATCKISDKSELKQKKWFSRHLSSFLNFIHFPSCAVNVLYMANKYCIVLYVM